MVYNGVSTPALTVLINGVATSGLLQARISSTNGFCADTFSLTFATGDLPLWPAAGWSELNFAYVELYAADTDSVAPTLLISGLVDLLDIDPLIGTAVIDGRDLSAALIEAYRQQDFVNQTASEIVAAIAKTHGLTATVTATQPNIGRFCSSDYTQLSLAQFSRLRSDWDLVVQLARENSFDAYVYGTTLFFQPSSGPSAQSYLITTDDISTIRFERNLAISQAPQVRMQSWNAQNKALYRSDVNANEPPAVQTPATAGVGEYLFSGPNLTSQQVSQASTRYAAEIGRLRTQVSITMPWNLNIAPRARIQIGITSTSLDGIYQVHSVERQYNTIRGSTQHVRAALVQ